MGGCDGVDRDDRLHDLLARQFVEVIVESICEVTAGEGGECPAVELRSEDRRELDQTPFVLGQSIESRSQERRHRRRHGHAVDLHRQVPASSRLLEDAVVDE